MEKKEVIRKLAERKKMFEDYLELIRQQPALQASKYARPKKTFSQPQSADWEMPANQNKGNPAKPPHPAAFPQQ